MKDGDIYLQQWINNGYPQTISKYLLMLFMTKVLLQRTAGGL